MFKFNKLEILAFITCLLGFIFELGMWRGEMFTKKQIGTNTKIIWDATCLKP